MHEEKRLDQGGRSRDRAASVFLTLGSTGWKRLVDEITCFDGFVVFFFLGNRTVDRTVEVKKVEVENELFLFLFSKERTCKFSTSISTTFVVFYVS